MTTTRWILGDQLGPHFLGPDEDPGDHGTEPVLMIEARSAFRRRRYHRAKAHLILSAMRHRAAELGDRARYVVSTDFRSGLAQAATPLSVCAPTSWAGRRCAAEAAYEVLPSRGFVTSESEFGAWAASRGGRRLLMEVFYLEGRRRTGVLMQGEEPEGGRWNFDADNRQPPPRGVTRLPLPAPWEPVEDEIDHQVRVDLDRWERDGDVVFAGDDGPRAFVATRAEALTALDDFIAHRLPSFGPYEDAALAHDWTMAHSRLSAPLNLGLLHPLEVVGAAEAAYRRGAAPLASVEGFIRQVMGWRDFVWHLYWHFGPEYVETANALDAHEPLPSWWRDLDAESVDARCLSTALAEARERGWSHHIIRLMVLGNWGLQRGYDPRELTEWFTATYVDAYPWVMAANVTGMALYADGGRMATKPYAGGGAYIHRMTDYCRGCRYKPAQRVGEQGCPFTAGYWWFLDRNRDALSGNARMAQALKGLDRLSDLEAVVAQESDRGGEAP
ncbi:MAG: cryptochrome/photolyase family protein [Candidatus Nanopelagicales bacterium]